MGILDDREFDPSEIERRKQLVRDLFAGRPLNHVPVYLTVPNPRPRWSIREQFLDAEKQWEEAIAGARLTWRHVPEGDVVPAVRPDVGCSALATAFGAELYWGDDPRQTCGVQRPVLLDVREAWDLESPPADAGQLAEGTARVHLFAERGEGLVSVSLLDMAGGLNVAMDLLGGDRLYPALVEEPEAVECLLGKIQRLFLAAIDAQVAAAGGEGRITCTDFPEYWLPEGRKGHASDDISANISPALYDRFSRPFHDMVFRRHGGGGLHNCGPNPCLEGYLSHRPPPRSLDLALPYSRGDLPRMKRLLRKRAFLYLSGFPAGPAEAIRAYREIVDILAPEVIAIAHVVVPLDRDPAGGHREVHRIAEEYARRIDWGWLPDPA